MESLENIKVGDKVVRYTHWMREITTVTKVTKTQIHVGYNKYRKNDGWRINSDKWEIDKIEVLTEDILKDIKIEKEKKRWFYTLANIISTH